MDKLRADYARLKSRRFESDAISTDARLKTTGGTRKGRRLAQERRTARVEAIPVARLTELVDTFGTVQVETRKRGHKRYATLVTYIDQSRKREG